MPEIMMRLIDGLRLEHAIANLNFQNGLDKRFMYELVRSYPTIDAEPVRHGRWINDELHGKYICTCCNEGTWRGFGVFDFCPNCGAKMDGDE